MDEDPAGWLAARSGTHQKLVTLAVIVLLLGNLFPFVFIRIIAAGPFAGLMSGAHTAVSFVPLAFLAFTASRPFAEARRNGSMELLLATPLSPEAIVKGQWQALWPQLRAGIRISAVILAIAFILGWSSSLAAAFSIWSLPFLLMELLQSAQHLYSAIAVCWLGLYWSPAFEPWRHSLEHVRRPPGRLNWVASRGKPEYTPGSA